MSDGQMSDEQYADIDTISFPVLIFFLSKKKVKIEFKRTGIPLLRRLLIKPATDGNETCLSILLTWKRVEATDFYNMGSETSEFRQ